MNMHILYPVFQHCWQQWKSTCDQTDLCFPTLLEHKSGETDFYGKDTFCHWTSFWNQDWRTLQDGGASSLVYACHSLAWLWVYACRYETWSITLRCGKSRVMTKPSAPPLKPRSSNSDLITQIRWSCWPPPRSHTTLHICPDPMNSDLLEYTSLGPLLPKF